MIHISIFRNPQEAAKPDPVSVGAFIVGAAGYAVGRPRFEDAGNVRLRGSLLASIRQALRGYLSLFRGKGVDKTI